MHHTLVALVEDKPGVLNRVASLFRRRAFNIESLTVGRTDVPGISRMTLVMEPFSPTEELADEELARRAQAGSSSAFEEIVRRFQVPHLEVWQGAESPRRCEVSRARSF